MSLLRNQSAKRLQQVGFPGTCRTMNEYARGRLTNTGRSQCIHHRLIATGEVAREDGAVAQLHTEGKLLAHAGKPRRRRLTAIALREYIIT